MYYSKQARILKSLILCFILCITTGFAYAETYDEAMQLMETGELNQAIKMLQPLAEQGNTQAQVRLGNMYMNGLGTKPNTVEGLKWLRMAVEKGNAEAETILGNLYMNGFGVDMNKETGFEWYRMAAEKGFATAQFNMGVSYFRGDGVEQDHYMSYIWMNIAAKAGHKLAGGYAETLETILSPEQIEEGNLLIEEMSMEFNQSN